MMAAQAHNGFYLGISLFSFHHNWCFLPASDKGQGFIVSFGTVGNGPYGYNAFPVIIGVDLLVIYFFRHTDEFISKKKNSPVIDFSVVHLAVDILSQFP
jgi:hypothetical protein